MENPRAVQQPDRRIGKTKKAIKNALIILLGKKDMAQITVKELSDLADINRKTFYSHYQSIGDIFNEIENDLISSLQGIMQEFKFDNNRSQIHHLFKRLNNLINEDFDFYQRLVRLDASASLVKKIKDLIKNAVLPNIIAKTKMAPDLLAMSVEFVTAGVVSMYIEWLYSDKSIPLETLTETAAVLSFSSINTIENQLA